MRPPNPYAALSSLVDCTRQLDPEEVAELQLEQGYADRALGIYEALLSQEPTNAHYRRRRDALARLATAPQRPVRCVSASSAPPERTRRGGVEREPMPPSLAGVSVVEPFRPPPVGVSVADLPRDPEPPSCPRGAASSGGTLRGVASPGRAPRATRRGASAAPSPDAAGPASPPPVVRQLSIVGVGRR